MIFFDRAIELEKLRKELNDQTTIDRMTYEKNLRTQVETEVTTLKSKIIALESDLKIANAKVVQAKAEAKAEYAEHVMQVTDDRVTEMRTVYENYAKNIVEIVKASMASPLPVLVQTNTNTNTTSK